MKYISDKMLKAIGSFKTLPLTDVCLIEIALQLEELNINLRRKK